MRNPIGNIYFDIKGKLVVNKKMEQIPLDIHVHVCKKNPKQNKQKNKPKNHQKKKIRVFFAKEDKYFKMVKLQRVAILLE